MSARLTLVIVCALTLAAANLIRGHFGRNWMAIRDMDTSAAVIGIPVHRYKILAFATFPKPINHPEPIAPLNSRRSLAYHVGISFLRA